MIGFDISKNTHFELSHYLINSIPRYLFTYTTYGQHYLQDNIFETKIQDRAYLSTDVIYIKNVLLFLFLDINSQYKLLSDIVAVDYPYKKYRFQLIYNVLSISYSNRLFIHFYSSELEKVPSIISIFPCACWYEREIWDLFGIHFFGNNDLRRILTDYGFVGHPLRKDFPLSGYTELLYNYKVDGILEKPITLVQEFRVFDTLSPWSYWTNSTRANLIKNLKFTN